jgi:hypothetical protein
MSRKAKTGSKALAPKTVSQFKAWLDGITAFQPNDWCPTAEQWKIIKEQIDLLKDEVIREVKVRDDVQVTGGGQPRRPIPQPTSLMEEPFVEYGSAPTQPIAIPDGVPPEILGQDIMKAAGMPVPAAGAKVDVVSSRVLNTGKTIKTPNNLGDGPYKSPFG